MPLYIIRHAHKERDRKRYPVDDETPLSAEGAAQLPGVGQALKDAILSHGHHGKCVVISSPQLRARATTEGIVPALDEFGPLVKTDARFKEISRGSDYSLTREERTARNPHHTWRNEALKQVHPYAMWLIKTPDGEDVWEVFRRVHHGMQEVRKGYAPQDTVIVVSSDIPCRLLTMMEAGKKVSWYDNEPSPGYGSIRMLVGDRWGELEDKGYVHEGIKQERTTGRGM